MSGRTSPPAGASGAADAALDALDAVALGASCRCGGGALAHPASDSVTATAKSEARGMAMSDVYQGRLEEAS